MLDWQTYMCIYIHTLENHMRVYGKTMKKGDDECKIQLKEELRASKVLTMSIT